METQSGDASERHSALVGPWERFLVGNNRASVFQMPQWILRSHGAWCNAVTDWFVANESGIAPLKLESASRTNALRLYGQDYEDFIVEPGRESEFLLQTIQDLLTRKGWDLCDFRGLKRESAILCNFNLNGPTPIPPPELDVVKGKILLKVLQPPGYYRVKLPPTYEEYEKHLGKNLSYQVRSARKRRIKQFGSDGLRLANAETFDTDFDALVSLHTKRWESRGQSGIFFEQSETEALRNFCRQMLGEGRLLLYTVWFGDQPGGALLNFLDGKSILFFSSGFDPEYATHRPVNVLFSQAIQDGIAHGLEEFHLLMGREAYKSRWANDEEPIYRLLVVRRSLKGFLGYGRILADLKYWELRGQARTVRDRWREKRSKRKEQGSASPPQDAGTSAT